MSFYIYTLTICSMFLLTVNMDLKASELKQCRDSKTGEINQLMISCNQTDQANANRTHTAPILRSISQKQKHKNNTQIISRNAAINHLSRKLIRSNKNQQVLMANLNFQIIQLQKDIEIFVNEMQANKTNYEQIIKELQQEISKLKYVNRNPISTSSSDIEVLKLLAPKNCLPLNGPQQLRDIYVPGIGSTSVSCQDDPLLGAGWTVIQRRIDGSVDFYRNWSTYKRGFGHPHAEFFIGLEMLHHLTNSAEHELYIQLEDFENGTRYALYNSFVVGSEQELYELKSVGNYSGNAGDALKFNLNQKFSTHDYDNDYDEDNCAEDLQGAWWYAACGAINLNGLYLKDNVNSLIADKGIIWGYSDWHEWQYSFKSVTMMIRPKM